MHDKQETVLHSYLDGFGSLVGDRRTEQLFRGIVQGIIGAESLVCSRISAFSPLLASSGDNAEQRIRRMAKGETTKRSDLDADHLVERLQALGVQRLKDEEELWVIVDPSELRKPYAHEMEYLQQVRNLDEVGTVPGYRTINVLGVGREGRRGILYHHLFSSRAEDFDSESKEIRRALDSVGEALAERAGKASYIMDTQFDDVAVWGAIWEQGNHVVCRLKHQERVVERPIGEDPGKPEVWLRMSVSEAKGWARELARVRSEMLVCKRGQRYRKRQPVTARIAATPIRVSYQVDIRTRFGGAIREKQAWLVVVTLENVDWEPWVLLTDWPVEDAESALRVFRMYRQRWAVEDCFKFTKGVLGWEDVQLLDFEGVRTLVALGWVAAGFLYELGVTLEWPEVRLLARLGGWVERPDRPPGKTIITRGLQRLLDHWATDAILLDEIARHGQLPPRLAALIGWGPKGRL